MRSLLRFIVIILSSVVACFALLLTIVSITSRPPKESKIISDFNAHRAAYEQVRTMLSEDKGVDLVADWGIENTGSPMSKIPPDGEMPVARYQEYLALLKQTRAKLVARGEEPHEVCFGTWASGFAGETRHLEVCWLEREPSNTVASLDAFYATPKPRKPSYAPIDGNWHIWADW
jgi:hypothetical protein